ncbi:hypothetical protein B5E48_07105 [Massilimicrobiota sp. An105]|uniref:hypothetical protein n=1 Tax=Massilimicrobiota sp. An105 TaxID=1965540 RepID=UPI000B3A863E|nr:hypothetical protein [Massilimicrobiota sp. An105]OUQ78554.1 hypothetical protein B5E48_07105 [Massilimicrobiota sp. An105]
MKKTRKILALGLSLVMMLALCLTAGTVNAAGDVASKEVSTAKAFKEAFENDTDGEIRITGSFTITEPMNTNPIPKTIIDERANPGTGYLANLINIDSQEHYVFDNVVFEANEHTKNLLSVNGGAIVTIMNSTFNHQKASDGAPVIINKSEAYFTGVNTLNLGEKSWYGINVDGDEDHGYASFSNGTIVCHTVDSNPTQSVVCTDNFGWVDSLNLSTVMTDDGKSRQLAYVNAGDLVDFIAAKKDKNVVEVNIREDIPLKETFNISEAMTIIGDGGAFVADNFTTKDNVVTVTSKGVQLDNVKIVTDESTKSGLHIYGGEVTATHLTVDNRNTAGGAAVVLNGGQLDLNGTTTFQLGENSWGAINIDNRSNVDPVLNIANNATINVSSPDESVGLYYVDADKQDSILLENVVNLPETVTVTMNNKEVTVNNGVITEPTQPTDPTTPGEDSKPEQPEQPEQETITITMKAIVDGKEVNLEELGLTLEDTQIKGIAKGSVLSEADLKELDSMKDGFNFEGYTFKGFFLDVEGTEPLKASVPFNEDTTIYMIWDKNIDVTVTPNPEDTDKPVQDTTTNKPEQKPAESDKTVKTDDNSQTILYGLMLSLSIVGTGIVVLNKKREKLLNK